MSMNEKVLLDVHQGRDGGTRTTRQRGMPCHLATLASRSFP